MGKMQGGLIQRRRRGERPYIKMMWRMMPFKNWNMPWCVDEKHLFERAMEEEEKKGTRAARLSGNC